MRNKDSCIGSMVLGLHDAMVSALGLITGLTVAMADRYTIVLTVLIASITSAFSMTASQYLAEKANGNIRIALRSGACTGVAYIVTAMLQTLPFIVLTDNLIALYSTYAISVLIILIFNYVKSRILSQDFISGFVEMLIICTGVSVAAFVIGLLAQIWFGVAI